MTWKKTKYHDKYNALHHAPAISPLASENAPLFTGGEQILQANFSWYDKNQAEWSMEYLELLVGTNLPGFWNKVQRILKWDWMVTPESDRYDFSKDNWVGAWSMVLTVKRLFPKVYEKHKALVKKMPLIHKQTLHPLTFFMILRAKYNVKLFDGIIKKIILHSYTVGHKERGGRKIAKTDGRIMGLYIYLMFGWDITQLKNLLMKKSFSKPYPGNLVGVPLALNGESWHWKNFNNVFRDYFPFEDHPLVLLSKKIY